MTKWGISKLSMQTAIAELLADLEKNNPEIFEECMKQAGLTKVNEGVK